MERFLHQAIYIITGCIACSRNFELHPQYERGGISSIQGGLLQGQDQHGVCYIQQHQWLGSNAVVGMCCGIFTGHLVYRTPQGMSIRTRAMYKWAVCVSSHYLLVIE